MAWNSYLEKIKDALWRDRIEVNAAGRDLEDLKERPLARPPVDVYEGLDELLLRVDVPGAATKDVAVSVGTGGRMVLCARSAAPLADRAVVHEWDEGLWYRALDLPDSVDVTRASAKLKEGVLTVRVPKRKGAQPRLVPVTSG